MRRRKSRRRKPIPHEKKVKFAAKLRKRMTSSEQMLWTILRSINTYHGTNFQPQQIFCGFIPDFYCSITRVVIEVDGSIHNRPRVARRDRIKDSVYHANRATLLRFTNCQVKQQLREVTSRVLLTIGISESPIL